MSNNDDFDFNRDDLFDDFDDDSGGDDFGGDDFGSDDFDFGDDSDDFNLDDDNFGSDLDSALGGDDGGDDDDFGTTESNQAGGGTSRGFIIVAIMMGLFFLVGIALLVYALFFYENPADVEFAASATAISLTNEAALTQISASATVAIENATATQEAFVQISTETQQAIVDATASYVPPSPTPTEDLTATAIEATNQVISAQETINAQVSIDATNTEIAFQLTLNPVTATPQGGIPTEPVVEGSTEVVPQGNTPVPLPAVQQTATALAELFAATPTTSGAQPTDIAAVGTDIGIGGGGTPTGSSTSGSGNNGQLPNTGLFDEVFQGNPAFIFLAAFGLLGVIVFSRSVRSRKRHD